MAWEGLNFVLHYILSVQKLSASCDSLTMPNYSPLQSLLDLITAELGPGSFLSTSAQRLTGKEFLHLQLDLVFSFAPVGQLKQKYIMSLVDLSRSSQFALH